MRYANGLVLEIVSIALLDQFLWRRVVYVMSNYYQLLVLRLENYLGQRSKHLPSDYQKGKF